ncbi:C6 finger domain-containing [Fusarium albosuccineum]|uniref:C6 finger domain-containing n=1 Tax=Fusarium albosuccineum TaxID=1237068 RepID=A0A8H4KRG6_9HYPO|nr:C6 finger domain-containing [Fusarium albosuccineum]
MAVDGVSSHLLMAERITNAPASTGADEPDLSPFATPTSVNVLSSNPPCRCVKRRVQPVFRPSAAATAAFRYAIAAHKSPCPFLGLESIDNLDIAEFLNFGSTDIDGPTIVDTWDPLSPQRPANLEQLPAPGHQRKRRHRACQQTRQTSIPLPLQDIWPRVREVETWKFCAKELLSFVTLFATTATSSFILQPAGNRLHTSLRRALGVCAASYTLSEQPFDQLLEDEMQHLTEASTVGDMSVMPGDAYSQTLSAFRQHLARLQAMALYQIIGLFSDNTRRQRRAKQHEALMASWTRELLLCIQLLELKSKEETPIFRDFDLNNPESVTEGPPAFSSCHNTPLQKEEIESAYKTVLVSYFARCVNSILRDQKWGLVVELSWMPVLVPPQQGTKVETHDFFDEEIHTMAYYDFADLWGQKKSMPGLDAHDRFIVLLLVAYRKLMWWRAIPLPFRTSLADMLIRVPRDGTILAEKPGAITQKRKI